MSEAAHLDILRGKEERAAYQRELISRYRLPLVSFTPVYPGPEKCCAASLIIFEAGLLAIKAKLAPQSIVFSDKRERLSGYEGFFAVNDDPRQLKRLLCEVETEHPLGRLFDLDVIGTDGVPISRTEIGLAGRKCLLCEKDAAVCVRSKTHTVSELLCEINRLLNI